MSHRAYLLLCYLSMSRTLKNSCLCGVNIQMEKESENKINVTNRSSEYIRALEEM